MRESAIESYLCKRVAALGGLCLKWVSPGRTGVPDRIVFWPNGKTSLVEVKRPEGKIAKIQKLTIEQLIALGQDVTVVWSTEHVDEFIASRA